MRPEALDFKKILHRVVVHVAAFVSLSKVMASHEAAALQASIASAIVIIAGGTTSCPAGK